MTDSLLDYVVAQLRDRKGQWRRISKETGVAMTTIQGIAHRTTPDPRVRKIEILAAYFRARAAALEESIRTQG